MLKDIEFTAINVDFFDLQKTGTMASFAIVFANMIPATNTVAPQAMDMFPSIFCGSTISSCQNRAKKLRDLGFSLPAPPLLGLFRKPG